MRTMTFATRPELIHMAWPGTEFTFHPDRTLHLYYYEGLEDYTILTNSPPSDSLTMTYPYHGDTDLENVAYTY